MKKITLLLGMALTFVLTSCSLIFGNKMTEKDGINEAKAILEKEQPFVGKEFYKVGLHTGKPLEDAFKGLTAVFKDPENEGKYISQAYWKIGKLQNPQGDSVSDNLTPFKVEEIDTDMVVKDAAELYKFLENNEELKDFNRFNVRDMTIIKWKGQFTILYNVTMRDKSGGTTYSGRKRTISYYEISVSRDNDGKYIIEDQD